MLKVKLLYGTALIPTVGHPGEDLGYDLYADLEHGAPENSFFALGGMIEPHKIASIPTGISIEFQPKAGGLILTRSSMAKKGIIVVGGVIDAGYRGEIVVMMANLTDTPYVVQHHDKIAQLVRSGAIAGEVTLVETLAESVREQMGFGSTGK